MQKWSHLTKGRNCWKQLKTEKKRERNVGSETAKPVSRRCGWVVFLCGFAPVQGEEMTSPFLYKNSGWQTEWLDSFPSHWSHVSGRRESTCLSFSVLQKRIGFFPSLGICRCWGIAPWATHLRMWTSQTSRLEALLLAHLRTPGPFGKLRHRVSHFCVTGLCMHRGREGVHTLCPLPFLRHGCPGSPGNCTDTEIIAVLVTLGRLQISSILERFQTCPLWSYQGMAGSPDMF